MMKATQIQEGDQLTIRVEGRLLGPWVDELERSWSQAAAAHGAARVQVQLVGVSFIDDAGKQLLRKMHGAGTRILAAGCLTRAIVEEVEGEAPRPRQRSGAKHLACLLAALLLFSGRMGAQSKPAQAPAPPVLKLTLHDAVLMALRQNPQVQIGMIDLAESQQNVHLARAGLLPQASLDVSDRAERANVEANFGGPLPVPGFPEHIGPFQVFDAGSMFSMPIFDLTLWQRWRGAPIGRRRRRSTRTGDVTCRFTIFGQPASGRRRQRGSGARSPRPDALSAGFRSSATRRRNGFGYAAR
jgi:hypothetical protein